MLIQWQSLMESYSYVPSFVRPIYTMIPTRILSKDGRGRYFELITSSSVLSLFNLSLLQESNGRYLHHRIEPERQ